MAKKKGNDAAKAAKKEAQMKKANKKQSKGQGPGDDIEQILSQIEQEEKTAAVTLKPSQTVPCEPPAPRNAATAVLGPQGDIIVFGGEYYDGQNVRVFNELYRCNINKAEKLSETKDEAKPGAADDSMGVGKDSTEPEQSPDDTVWREVVVRVRPKPRCGHQAVVVRNNMYVWGGEFATVEQFWHYSDLWCLDMKSWTWTEVKTTGKPPQARSGHRMTHWRNHLFLFGGFHDTARETRYFNDCYMLNLTTLKWQQLTFPPHSSGPTPRSGSVVVAVDDGVFIHGGFTKIKDTKTGTEGKIHSDSYFLRLTPFLNSTPLSWERLPRKGFPPSLRSGASGVLFKKKVVVFGGVYDEDEGGLASIRSVFFNDLHIFDVETRRWHQIHIREKSKVKKQGQPETPAETLQTEIEDSDGVVEEDDYDEIFAYIDQDGKLVRVKITDCEDDDEGLFDRIEKETTAEQTAETTEQIPETLEKAEAKIPDDVPELEAIKGGTVEVPKTTLFLPQDECPLPRINANLVVTGNRLVVMGGVVEIRTREVTMDDMWTVSLLKRDRWQCLSRGTIDAQPWIEDEEEEEGEDDDESDDSDDSEDPLAGLPIREQIQAVQSELQQAGTAAVSELLPEGHPEVPVSDLLPKPNEKCRDHFERTKELWTMLVKPVNLDLDPKELRRTAYDVSSELYSHCADALSHMERLEGKLQQKPQKAEKKDEKKTRK
ncbi:MAG: uncharacterized protein KVP18_003806 [Porospora cf. gigantea A]|uniref:uncharacterized protein n=1 Tax=Porospora cf. gigantea A TaxID=2853593 RepID=UPI00355A25A1|nr:MAG: hypothetical protein KVP18_003806 [Porospora cf. gigantea A]